MFGIFHSSNKSKIPKIISGILAAILAVVLAHLILSSLWFWISWEVLAAGLVAIGCFGEWYLFKNPPKIGDESKHHLRELQFISIVTIGVTMEFFALAHAIREALRLERDVSQANQRVEELRNDNLSLIKDIGLVKYELVENKRGLENLRATQRPRIIKDMDLAARERIQNNPGAGLFCGRIRIPRLAPWATFFRLSEANPRGKSSDFGGAFGFSCRLDFVSSLFGVIEIGTNR